jgi:hypothetical protein
MEALESLLQDLESRESDLLSCCNRIENFSAHVDRVDGTSSAAILEPHRKLDEIQVVKPCHLLRHVSLQVRAVELMSLFCYFKF